VRLLASQKDLDRAGSAIPGLGGGKREDSLVLSQPAIEFGFKDGLTAGGAEAFAVDHPDGAMAARSRAQEKPAELDVRFMRGEAVEIQLRINRDLPTAQPGELRLLNARAKEAQGFTALHHGVRLNSR